MFNAINVALVIQTVEALCVCFSQWLNQQVFAMHVPFVCVHVSEYIHERMWVMCHSQSIITELGRGTVQFKYLRVCVCLWFSNMEGNVVFWLPICSIIFVPLNKHLWLDESVSVSCPAALWEIMAGGPCCITINHSVCSHHSTLQWDSRHIHTSHTQLPTYLLTQIYILWKTYSSNQTRWTDGCLLTWRICCSFQWEPYEQALFIWRLNNHQQTL